MQDDNTVNGFEPFEKSMRTEGLPPLAIATFKYYYSQLVTGNSGLIPESEIEPVASLPAIEELGTAVRRTGARSKPATVVIKLNGGLGTSMGLDRAKSLIEVKQGLNFLDIISRQSISNGVPLMLMNSFATRDDSLAVLDKYPELREFGIAADFVQNKVPKVSRTDLQPARCPQAPYLEWCPPGHGDIYTALVTSGCLERLLKAGYRYAFISNADNLGAVLDETILGYLVEQQCPFLMEVADRTEADRKGGHLAVRRADGQLILRESAQCPEADIPAFQDISRYRYFNTNNLWLDLRILQETMAARNNILGLPLICNSKHIDPRDESSQPVFQLETAMGAAISVFDGAQAIRVPRSRFAPVKTTNDLLTIRSDAYTLTDDYQLHPSGAPGETPVINLDSRYFKSIDAFEARFPDGVPSLASCRRLTVTGDVKFGENIKLVGDVNIDNQTGKQILIEQNSIIQGEFNCEEGGMKKATSH